MAQNSSFDVTTGVDLQEVDNAINQAQKEIGQRFDFKGSKASIEFNRAEAVLVLVSDNDFQMRSLFDVVQTRLIKRCVPVKNLDVGEVTQAGGNTVRREVKLKTSLDGETAKKVVEQLKPRLFIFPMHYGTKVYTDVLPPDEFLERVGSAGSHA